MHMIGRLLLVGFILLLVVLIIWMLFKISSQSRQIEYLQQQTPSRDYDTTLHGRMKPAPTAAELGGSLVAFAVQRIVTDNIPNAILDNIPHNIPATTTGAEYYEAIQRDNHADDTQNVHDSMVISELKKRYDRLIELNQSALVVPTDIADYVNQNDYADMFCQTMFIELGNYCQTYFDPVTTAEKFSKAQKVIETARDGSIFTGFIEEVREDWILAHVWYRIHSSDNATNREQLLNALMDQLQDAGKYALAGGFQAAVAAIITGIPPVRSQELTTECTTGRIGRYFQTFTLLDADPLLCKPILDEKEYENEAYAKSYKILTKFIDDNPGMDLLYHTSDESTLTDPDKEKLQQLKEGARTAIRDAITNDYEGLMSTEKLNILIEKCVAGV